MSFLTRCPSLAGLWPARNWRGPVQQAAGKERPAWEMEDIFHVPLQDAFCSILLRPAADNRVYRREYNPDVAHNGNVYSA
jgi:hypothetical protein